MGIDFSALASSRAGKPPKVVLIPPLFERDLKARSRMVKSSFDYMFCKPALRWLFEDYMGSGVNSTLFFAPSADPRVSVKAKLGTGDAGTMTIRYQPLGATEPLCFMDIKANPRVPGDVTLRMCGFSTATGLGAFANLPLAAKVTGKVPQVGLRYSSPSLTAGAVLQPPTGALSHLWLCGRYQGVSAGVQLKPGPSSDWPSAAKAAGGGGDPAALAEWLRRHCSAAIAYSPEGRTRGGQASFTAAMEVEGGSTFVVSFFQHMATVRQVFNPFEESDVIGITSYIDVGLRLVMPLADSSGAGGASLENGLQLAAAWQVNKNVYLKARLANDSVALMGAFKSWFQPSLALAGSCEYRFGERLPRYGLSVQVENFGALRYEKSRAAEAHGKVLTQMHEATSAEVAVLEGLRPLVERSATDGSFNVAEPVSVTYL